MSMQLIPPTIESDAGAAELDAFCVPGRAARRDLQGGATRVRRETCRVGGRSFRRAERAREATSGGGGRLRGDAVPADERPRDGWAGDLASVGPLYARYAKRIYGIALAILKSRDEAEDLIQDVFVTMCRPTGYDCSRGSIGAFLTTMTRSRAIDRLRCRRRSVRLLKTWHEGAPFAEAPTIPSEDLSMRRAAEGVRAALARLPEAQRRVLEMAYYRGLSQQEIAGELEAPLGTVKSWSRQALLELEEALSESMV